MSVRNDLIGDRRGSAAVEFAFIVPIVLALYFGMVEATQALLANRRASYLATAVGDLVTQSAQVREGEVTDIFKASASVMRPFPTDALGIRVTSIKIDASGVPSVDWTRYDGTIPATDLSTIDAKMRVPNTALLRAETRYVYDNPFQKMLPGAFTFKHKMDLRPRSGLPIQITN